MCDGAAGVGEMDSAQEGSSIGYYCFILYIHLLPYIRTNLLPATLILDTKKTGVGAKAVRSLFTQFR